VDQAFGLRDGLLDVLVKSTWPLEFGDAQGIQYESSMIEHCRFDKVKLLLLPMVRRVV
jgi:hypothetical protein